MNANELADLIGMCGDGGYNQDAATMLRQQQAEIEALKAGKIRAYDNGVEDGRKPNTNLVKEQLTDEEWLITYQTWALTSNDPLVLKRAILRKAQER